MGHAAEWLLPSSIVNQSRKWNSARKSIPRASTETSCNGWLLLLQEVCATSRPHLGPHGSDDSRVDEGWALMDGADEGGWERSAREKRSYWPKRTWCFSWKLSYSLWFSSLISLFCWVSFTAHLALPGPGSGPRVQCERVCCLARPQGLCTPCTLPIQALARLSYQQSSWPAPWWQWVAPV